MMPPVCAILAPAGPRIVWLYHGSVACVPLFQAARVINATRGRYRLTYLTVRCEIEKQKRQTSGTIARMQLI